MAQSPFLHPFIIFLASNTAFNITAAFTSYKSPVRYITVAYLALCAYIFPHSLASYAQTTGWAGRIAAGAAFWNIVSCFDRLILRGWDYNHYGPSRNTSDEKAKAAQAQKSNNQTNRYSGTRTDFGSEVTGSARGIGHFWQVKNVPYFSHTNPRFVPSKAAFILMQSIVVTICYYLHNWTVELVLGLDRRYLSPERVPLLTRPSEVSFAELQARFVASLGYWVIQYCIIQFFYSVAGIVGALSNPNSIYLWRPLFGSPWDAYTLRDFWGKAWHQNLRSGLEGLSSFFTHDILQLPEKGLLQRYTKVISCFALSGLMHNVADMGGGLAFYESGAVQFFCMQALGVIMEDGVQAVYRNFYKQTSGPKVLLVKQAIGYLWVLLFVVWTTPVWVFPATLNMRKEDALLNLDAVKPVFVGR